MQEPDQLPLEWPEPPRTLEPVTHGPEANRRQTSEGWPVPLAAGFLGATLAVVVVLASGIGRTPTPPVGTIPEVVRTEIVTPDNVTVGNQAAAVARRVVPSVVTVETFQGTIRTGSGSGVILDADQGYIVTNQHVVEDDQIVGIVLSDGRRYDGSVIGTDVLTDLAVVQVEAFALVAIERGSTDGLMVGEAAIAVGNPLGLQGGPTVTVGVVSAFDRQVEGGTGEDDLFGMLQTDAPFTRGSSGGALVDLEGRLIGITTAVAVSDLGAEGLGFATPIEVVNRVTNEIIASGESSHGFLGISGTTELEAQPDGGEAPIGVLVSQLLDGSSAGAGGIAEGDVITTVNGVEVTTMPGLVAALRRYSPGDDIVVEYRHEGELLEVTFPLGARTEG